MVTPRRTRPLSLMLAVALATGAACGSAWAGSDEDQRVGNALRVMTDIQKIPESAIPDKLLDEARAIVVIPDSLKVGLVLGGRSGHGLLAVKDANGTWSNPVFVKLTGGSIGFQAGVQSSDIVLIFRNDRSLESIVNGKVTLGADAGVAAGPVGRNAAMATDGQLKASIWSWSRSRGLFAGVALDGAVLSIDDDSNEAVYGRDTTPRMVFEGRAQQQPGQQEVAFRDMLEEATAAARSRRGTDPAASGAAQATTAAAPQPQPQPQGEPQPAPAAQGAQATQPSTFQPVDNAPPASDSNPAQVETLPATP